MKPSEVLYLWKALDARMLEMIFRVVDYTNTKNKYTKTVYTQIPQLIIIYNVAIQAGTTCGASSQADLT